MRYLIILLSLLSTPAMAQALSEVEVVQPHADDHSGQDLEVQSITTSASSGDVAVTVQPGALQCFDGLTGAACISYDFLGDVLEFGKKVSAQKFTSTALSGTAAFQATTGAEVCLNGATCTHSVKSDGTGVVVSGTLQSPSLETPTSNDSTFTGTFTAGRIDATGIALNDPTTPVTIEADSKMCLNGALCTKSIHYGTASNYVTMNGLFVADIVSSQGSIEVRDGSLQLKGTGTNVTCQNTTEGFMKRISGTGANTTFRTKICICISNGSNGYFWHNLTNNTDGSATNC